MATLTIRHVDERVHARLREQAARHGCSVEAEVRRVLAAAVEAPTRNFLLEMRDALGADAADLPIPARVEGPREVPLP